MIIDIYKGKYYDVEYSLVKTTDLEGELRIDAEYYDPFYLKKELLISGTRHKHLGEIFKKIRYGKTPKNYTENGRFYVVRSGDLDGVFINKNGLLKTNEEYLFELRIFDILISSIGKGSIGKIAINLESVQLFTVSEVTVLRECNENPFYVLIFLQSIFGQVQINKQITGATGQLHLLPSNVKRIKIPIPSSDFQKLIEKLVLNAYDEKKKAEQLYKQAEDILLEELGLKNWKPKTKTIKIGEVEFEEEENISIRNLSDVVKADRMDAEYWEPRYDEIEGLLKAYKGGHDYLSNLINVSKKKIAVNKDEIYHYIELADINLNLGMINQTKQIIGRDLPSRARMEVDKGDVLMSSVEGSIEKIALIDFEKPNLVASTGFFVFKEKNLNKETILVLLKILAKRYLIREAQGTILTAIPYDSLNRMLLPKINKNIQLKISQLIQQSFKARETSKNLLDIAKKAVEIYIEKDEKEGIEWLKNELKNIQVNI